MTDTEISRQNQTCPFAYPFDRPSTLGVSALYEEIRGGEGTVPVTLPSGDSGFIVTRYDDVKTVFGDRRFSRAATLQPDAPRLGPAPQNFPTLLNMDAPDHSRVRKMIAGSFTARRVETLRPRVQEHVDELITAMVEAGPGADLMTAYAAPLPVLVICELLESRSRIARSSGSGRARSWRPRAPNSRKTRSPPHRFRLCSTSPTCWSRRPRTPKTICCRSSQCAMRKSRTCRKPS